MSKGMFIILLMIMSTSVIPARADKTLTAEYLNASVTIDGRLNEAFYQRLTPSNHFYQFHPKNGEKSTYDTEIYAFYDSHNLYFAFKCYDREPQKIAADVTPFGEFHNNDVMAVYLDTFLDKKTFEYFAVNPKGIKDGKRTVWEADAHITPFGWSAEIKIPFKSLRFPVKQVQNWGVNFRRTVYRLNETSYWAPVSRDKAGVLGDTFGRLEGIRDVRGGKNLEIFPYAGYRDSRSPDEKDSKFAYGLDLKYGITSNLTMDLTTSPDYSEVESDPFFYQLEPYEHGLQENRPFYYEGNSYFNTYFRLFYSRRISNPTLALKLTGKEKGVSVGMLAARNKLEDQSTFHGVLRLKKDIASINHIGLIYTSLEEKETWNRNVGIDFQFKLKDVNTLMGMVAASINKNESNRQNKMAHLRFLHVPDEGFIYGFVYTRVEPNVNVPAGFVTYLDYQHFWTVSNYRFRWEGKWLESLTLKFITINEYSVADNYKVATNKVFAIQGTTRSRITFNLTHEGGKLRNKILDQEENLVWDSEIFPFGGLGLYLSYDGNRIVQLNGHAAYWYSGFVYNEEYTDVLAGKMTEISFDANIKLSPQLHLDFQYGFIHQWSKDSTVNFRGELISSRINYQINRKIFSFLKFQYDSYLERFQYDFLIGYEPANVSKIYLSFKNYSENRFRLLDPDARSISIKISYLMRI